MPSTSPAYVFVDTFQYKPFIILTCSEDSGAGQCTGAEERVAVVEFHDSIELLASISIFNWVQIGLAWPFTVYTIRVVELISLLPSAAISLGRVSLLAVILFYALLFTWTFAGSRLRSWFGERLGASSSRLMPQRNMPSNSLPIMTTRVFTSKRSPFEAKLVIRPSTAWRVWSTPTLTRLAAKSRPRPCTAPWNTRLRAWDCLMSS